MSYKNNANETVDNIQYDQPDNDLTPGEVFATRDVWMPQVQSWSPVYPSLT